MNLTHDPYPNGHATGSSFPSPSRAQIRVPAARCRYLLLPRCSAAAARTAAHAAALLLLCTVACSCVLPLPLAAAAHAAACCSSPLLIAAARSRAPSLLLASCCAAAVAARAPPPLARICCREEGNQRPASVALPGRRAALAHARAPPRICRCCPRLAAPAPARRRRLREVGRAVRPSRAADSLLAACSFASQLFAARRASPPLACREPVLLALVPRRACAARPSAALLERREKKKGEMLDVRLPHGASVRRGRTGKRKAESFRLCSCPNLERKRVKKDTKSNTYPFRS